MEERITNNKNNLFTGVTTIELFDSETGDKVYEYKKENTYNERIPWINYLSTMMKSGSDKFPTANTDDTKCFQAHEGNYQYSVYDHLKYNKTEDLFYRYQNIQWPKKATGGSTSNYYIPFCDLVLTNNTLPSSSTGEFNGSQIGIANFLMDYSDDRACTGMINNLESRFDNDKLRLVFDFDTAKCHGTFDSVWLLPAFIYSSSSITTASIKPFTSFSFLTETKSTVAYNYKRFATNTNYLTVNRLNQRYHTLMDIYNGSATTSTINGISLHNQDGDEISSMAITGSVKSSAYFFNIYFDEERNRVYGISPTSSHAVSTTYPTDVAAINATIKELYYLDLTTGQYVSCGTMSDLIGATANPTQFDPAINMAFDVCYVNNEVYLVFNYGVTAERSRVYDIKKLSFTDNGISSEDILKVKLYHGVFNTGLSQYRQITIGHDGDIYLLGSPDETQKTALDKMIRVNLNNKEIVNDVISVPNYGSSFYYGFNSDTIKSYSTAYVHYDDNVSKDANCFGYNNISTALSNINVSASSVKTVEFFDTFSITTPWTTHNKLTEPVIKDETKTMKITYDIIWDRPLDDVLKKLK
ncbi:hypothetical protein M2140_000171 [Clostridiales Family XIII bacterium PM5-7]